MGRKQSVRLRPIADISEVRHTAEMKPLSLLTLSLLISGCGSADWERQSFADSPDKSLRAIIDYDDAAACCSDHSRLRLVELSEGTLSENPKVVVEATRARMSAHWESNDRLIVEACGSTEHDVFARVLRQQAFRPDGTENAVRIEVISTPDTVREGRVFCPTPAVAQ